MAVKKMRAMPRMMAFCCRLRLILILGRRLAGERRLEVDFLLELVLRLVVVFLLLLVFLRVIAQMFLPWRL